MTWHQVATHQNSTNWTFFWPVNSIPIIFEIAESLLLWQNIAWEEFEPHPFLFDGLFIQLIGIAKNTQVLNISNGHFWPMSFPFLLNTPSLTPLICWSLSLCLSVSLSFSLYSPLCSHLLQFNITTLLIWWDVIIVINWLKVNSCFTWELLTILLIKS